MRALILSTFGAGYLRPAPGTWGALAALPLALGVITIAGAWGLVGATVFITALGTYLTALETAASGAHDPSWIVIDEVAGQWVALWPVAFGAAITGAAPTDLWPGWLAAFLLFRLFDIWKPGLIGVIDRREDALGVMLDDIVAGLFAAAMVLVLAGLAHLTGLV